MIKVMFKIRRLKSKYKKLRAKVYMPKAVLYAALAIATLTIGLWAFEAYYEPFHQPQTTKTYKSLNLAEAMQATYVNSAISKIKDLGTSNKARHELVSFDVPKDDLKEFALMTLPITGPPKNGKYPVIILCHGYTNPRSYSTLKAYRGDMEHYSQNGYVVIKPDYRGQGFSFTSGTPDGAYYSMSYNTDVLSLIAAVKQTPYLDKNNINLWGHSMGGYVALRAAVLSPDVKNLILLSAPVGTPQDMYADYSPISDFGNSVAYDIREEELSSHGTPLSNPNYWNKTSPLSYLKLLKANVQIHVGTADKTVPPKFSADLNDALNVAGKNHTYYVYDGGNHSLGLQRPVIWARSLYLLSKTKS